VQNALYGPSIGNKLLYGKVDAFVDADTTRRFIRLTERKRACKQEKGSEWKADVLHKIDFVFVSN
jgi:hypothetical protein